MRNITTYYIRRTNAFVWISACAMLASAILRILFFVAAPKAAAFYPLFRLVLPLAASFAFLFQVVFKRADRICVTAKTALFFALYFLIEIPSLGFGKPMTAAAILVTLVLTAIYYFCYAGRFHGTLSAGILLIAFFVCCGSDPVFRDLLRDAWRLHVWILFSDLLIPLAYLFLVLATHENPPHQEGEPYPYMLGDRPDGRLIRSNYPMANITPYFMPDRTSCGNLFAESAEISKAEQYIRQKRREGLKHFGLLHVVIAAYVRVVAEYPGVNRFIAGQKVYARRKIQICMTVKKDLSLNGSETIIKVTFDPHDTAEDVYRKFTEEVEKIKHPALDSGFDKIAFLIDYVPGLLKKFAIWLLKTLDYIGALPDFLLEASPFHGSVYLTDLGSLGLSPVYHHLYDFGAMTGFGAFGAKRTVTELNAQGEPVKKKYLDYTWDVDDRPTDGYYYAVAFKRFRSLIAHPERLDVPPERVVEDDF